jgi:hypothetical protein
MMHPCPFCHSLDLHVFETVEAECRVILNVIETTPPQFDYQEKERVETEVKLGLVTCAECRRQFVFDLPRYQRLTDSTTWWPVSEDQTLQAQEDDEMTAQAMRFIGAALLKPTEGDPHAQRQTPDAPA